MTNAGVAYVPESIAIIGMSGRFPKARDINEYWRNIRDGVECISFFSEDELIARNVDPEVLKDPSFVNAGGVLEDMDMFDASFFGLSARDAEIMDPQHRIFLECAAESLDAAGYDPETYAGLIGVFAGETLSSYIFDLYADPGLAARLDDSQIALGNEKDHLATQVSYRLNLRGPSMAIQSACSTSLVSVSVACQSLLNYQCDIALAGGVSADALTGRGYCYQPGGILSPDGHCRVFDAAAKGTVSGNGVGIVVLKRLSEAIADRDQIRAVIRGFALNNDGSHKVGYTAPSIEGQAQVVALAQAAARVEPETISYIETHGTGTELGDPIEIAGLRLAFQCRTQEKHFCAIGSVKSNIGHLDAAAGVASLIKTVLALENKVLPPSLHFTRPNPKIDFENSPFYVNTKLSEWKPANGVRRAGVSCFGIGGTNAHVIVEEAPPSLRAPHSRPCCVIKLSARTGPALEKMTDNLAEFLSQCPDADLANVAYTSQVGRRTFKHRRALMCPSLDTIDARKALAERDPQRLFSTVCESTQRTVSFLFPGQGTQHADMALSVYKMEPAFRTQVDICAEILKPHLGLNLRDLLYPAAEYREKAENTLRRTLFTQPALFTIEYALARMWMAWGIRPSAMIGHSIGEYVAACLAGVFSLEDALKLVAWRGQLMEETPPGAMLAVALSEPAARRYLDKQISLAAVNGPESCVLAGSLEAIESLTVRFSEYAIRHTRLNTSRAFHSSLLDSVVGSFVRRVRTVNLKAPEIPFLSNVTGEWITAETAMDPVYWGRQLRQPVRFADGLRQLCETPDRILLEVGPGQTLSNLARQRPPGGEPVVVFPSLSGGSNRQADIDILLGSWGKLWLHGAAADWKGFYDGEPARRIQIPGYPFERQRYWMAPSEPYEYESASEDGGVETTREVANWFYYPYWKPAPPVGSEPHRISDGKNKRWLVFGGEDGRGLQLIQFLREQGQDVISVVMGERFARIGAGDYMMRLREPGDYDAILREEIPNGFPNTIVHLWGVTPLSEDNTDDDTFERCQWLGFDSVVRLVQALERHYTAAPITITVVSDRTQAITGRESLCPAKATVLGACKVIPQEYPNIRCQSVDIDINDGPGLAANLMNELLETSFEPVVALRKGRRWIQGFEPVRLVESSCEAPGLRSGGVYLITGGLGKIGLVLAGYLARVAQAKLVLTGRTEFPARNKWVQWLRRNPNGAVSDRIRRLSELEELGAETMVAKADAADPDEMRQVIAEAERRFGAVHGVIHGAGDTETNSPITLIDPAVAGQQFRPKAGGVTVIDELFKDKDLDFVLLLSSLSSILGGLGLAAYAGANAFLDSIARERNRAGRVPWISVNWDGWQFPDSEAAETIDDSILPEEGEEAFRRILGRTPGQIIVSVSSLEERLNQWIRSQDVHQIPQSVPSGLAAQHSRPDLAVSYAPAKSEAEGTLVEIWQQLLGVAPIGIFDNFFDLGGHSLLAIQLISRIREAFMVEFPVHRVFETPTISELARTLSEECVAEDEAARAAQLLELVEQLSESEIAALLEQGTGAESGAISNA